MVAYEDRDAFVIKKMFELGLYEKLMECPIPNVEKPILIYDTGKIFFVRWIDWNDPKGSLLYIDYSLATEEEFLMLGLSVHLEFGSCTVLPDSLTSGILSSKN